MANESQATVMLRALSERDLEPSRGELHKPFGDDSPLGASEQACQECYWLWYEADERDVLADWPCKPSLLAKIERLESRVDALTEALNG